MTFFHGEYEIDEDRSRVDLDWVHGLLAKQWWCPGIDRDVVERAVCGASLVVGAYFQGRQVGFLRVVSDRATFGWFSDVIVDETHRGKGIAKALVLYALKHPEHQGFRRWVLMTRDKHAIYEGCGFAVVERPYDWMELQPQGKHY
jgi:GNAT superfamily N-acetyltransferase